MREDSERQMVSGAPGGEQQQKKTKQWKGLRKEKGRNIILKKGKEESSQDDWIFSTRTGSSVCVSVCVYPSVCESCMT